MQPFACCRQLASTFFGGGTCLPSYAGILLAVQELNLRLHHLTGPPGYRIATRLTACNIKTFNRHVLINEAAAPKNDLLRNWAGDPAPLLRFHLKSEPKIRTVLQKLLLFLKSYALKAAATTINTIARTHVRVGYRHNTIAINANNTSNRSFTTPRKERCHLYQTVNKIALEYLPKTFGINHQQTV